MGNEIGGNYIGGEKTVLEKSEIKMSEMWKSLGVRDWGELLAEKISSEVKNGGLKAGGEKT